MNSFVSREKARLADRLTRCQACGYPISERHHLFAVSVFGENECTLQLCANCHELYHLIESVVDAPYHAESTRPKLLLAQFISMYGDSDPRLVYLTAVVKAVHQARPDALRGFGFSQLSRLLGNTSAAPSTNLSRPSISPESISLPEIPEAVATVFDRYYAQEIWNFMLTGRWEHIELEDRMHIAKVFGEGLRGYMEEY